MIVCDGAAMPANPGVNPSLTIAALAEHAMAQIAPIRAKRTTDELIGNPT
jgi:cholesterol oxidase